MPTHVDRETFYSKISNFLRKAEPELDATEIPDDANLVDLGLIDSLRMVELIVVVEETLGVDIPVEELDPRAFHSLKSLYDRFGSAEGKNYA